MGAGSSASRQPAGRYRAAARAAAAFDRAAFDAGHVWSDVKTVELSASGKSFPNDVIHLRQVEIFDKAGKNWALSSNGGAARQASTHTAKNGSPTGAEILVDGDLNTNNHTAHKKDSTTRITLPAPVVVARIVIHNIRTENAARLNGSTITAKSASGRIVWAHTLQSSTSPDLFAAPHCCTFSKAAEEEKAAAGEAAAILSAVGVQADGDVATAEIRSHLRARGKTEDEVAALIDSVDLNSDGRISASELRAGLARSHKGAPTLRSLLAAAPDASSVDFSDLATAPNGCLRIADTARRSITLVQLRRVVAHCARRMGYTYRAAILAESYKGKHQTQGNHNNTYQPTLELSRWERLAGAGGEVWLGSRPDSSGVYHLVGLSLHAVNLYDCAKYVISPATAAQCCSMVELMANEEQPPDFFVSHFWAEPILDFLACLERHSETRRLEVASGFSSGAYLTPHPLYLGGRSPRYWVCAHANNQHDLTAEISDDLSQTSFYRAMRLARGTVSVIDSSAGCFDRIWCVYELYQSLVGSSDTGYTYDLATAIEWSGMAPAIDCAGNKHGINNAFDGKATQHKRAAVVITDGLSAEERTADEKNKLQAAFPIALLDQGIQFQCTLGQASMQSDKERILAAIGEESTRLDETVHGVLAVAALRMVMEAGGERRARYFEAIKRGHVPKLELDLSDGNMSLLCGTNGLLSGMGSLREVHFGDSGNLKSLPEELLRGLCSLEKVNIGCFGPKALPASLFSGLSALKTMDLHCSGLVTLPASLFSGLANLTVINMAFCSKLTTLPDGLFTELCSLVKLNISKCAALTKLPEGLFAGLARLEEVDFERCKALKELPEGSFDGCNALKTVILRETSITALPGILQSKADANPDLVVW